MTLRNAVVACMLALAAMTITAATNAAEPNDPMFHSQGSWQQTGFDQWALRRLNIYSPGRLAAQQRPMRSASQSTAPVVAVIDTGVDLNHPDFNQAGLWRNAAEKDNGRDDDGNGYVDDIIGWNFVANNNNPMDTSGHGTHVTGLINACTGNGQGIAAVAPNSKIMVLKVSDFTGHARSSAIAAAVDYAVRHGAKVINLSLGGSVATVLERQAVERANKSGVLVVVSAGNRGLQADQFGYAGIANVLVVGATEQAGRRAGFSNFGALVDLVAPGVDILSLRANQTDFIALTDPQDYVAERAVVGAQQSYYRATGTSFSAALVSGVAARLLGLRPDLTGEQLRRILRQSATDVGVSGVDQLTGYGQVDFQAAQAASADIFVVARLDNVALDLDTEVDPQRLMLKVYGEAQADQLATLKLELSQGQAATADFWHELDVEFSTFNESSLIAQFDLDSALALVQKGSEAATNHFTLRLLVSHINGVSRESRLSFEMPRS